MVEKFVLSAIELMLSKVAGFGALQLHHDASLTLTPDAAQRGANVVARMVTSVPLAVALQGPEVPKFDDRLRWRDLCQLKMLRQKLLDRVHQMSVLLQDEVAHAGSFALSSQGHVLSNVTYAHVLQQCLEEYLSHPMLSQTNTDDVARYFEAEMQWNATDRAESRGLRAESDNASYDVSSGALQLIRKNLTSRMGSPSVQLSMFFFCLLEGAMFGTNLPSVVDVHGPPVLERVMHKHKTQPRRAASGVMSPGSAVKPGAAAAQRDNRQIDRPRMLQLRAAAVFIGHVLGNKDFQRPLAPWQLLEQWREHDLQQEQQQHGVSMSLPGFGRSSGGVMGVGFGASGHRGRGRHVTLEAFLQSKGVERVLQQLGQWRNELQWQPALPYYWTMIQRPLFDFMRIQLADPLLQTNGTRFWHTIDTWLLAIAPWRGPDRMSGTWYTATKRLVHYYKVSRRAKRLRRATSTSVRRMVEEHFRRRISSPLLHLPPLDGRLPSGAVANYPHGAHGAWQDFGGGSHAHYHTVWEPYVQLNYVLYQRLFVAFCTAVFATGKRALATAPVLNTESMTVTQRVLDNLESEEDPLDKAYIHIGDLNIAARHGRGEGSQHVVSYLEAVLDVLEPVVMQSLARCERVIALLLFQARSAATRNLGTFEHMVPHLPSFIQAACDAPAAPACLTQLDTRAKHELALDYHALAAPLRQHVEAMGIDFMHPGAADVLLLCSHSSRLEALVDLIRTTAKSFAPKKGWLDRIVSVKWLMKALRGNWSAAFSQLRDGDRWMPPSTYSRDGLAHRQRARSLGAEHDLMDGRDGDGDRDGLVMQAVTAWRRLQRFLRRWRDVLFRFLHVVVVGT